ncbi:AliB-like protein [Streptococcus pneumoniae]|nr:AliB-like protein [Streptococcus pneumoniae]CKI67068.1 AliB-like protein [Streptococcus pneumoniae]CKI95136.1 AliB-like protein [Streptococcus pneumoniae]CKI97625.1 AliB-like protein [Streptococcus pneumoniae]CKI98656.1 AliB-like protein [Streptococcus pneumoniae]
MLITLSLTFSNFQQISTDDFNNVPFLAPTAADRDYDLNFDGWVGDYQDPSTYLNPFNAEDGFYLKIFGLDAKEDKEKITSLGLDTYTKMLKDAHSENKDVAKRYEKYAEAQV